MPALPHTGGNLPPRLETVILSLTCKKARPHEILSRVQVIIPRLLGTEIIGINILPVFLVNPCQHFRGEHPVGITLVCQQLIRVHRREMFIHFRVCQQFPDRGQCIRLFPRVQVHSRLQRQHGIIIHP